MPLTPSRTKYRKSQKGSLAGNAKGGNSIAFGEFAIQALDRGYFSSSQIEAARVAITRHMRRRGKVWIRVFPHKPVTKKPLETRMGKGKGPVEYYVAAIKPGTILFEVSGVTLNVAREAMRLADNKIPIRCRFVQRTD
jgi:large subunit ribosomal protein L16